MKETHIKEIVEIKNLAILWEHVRFVYENGFPLDGVERLFTLEPKGTGWLLRGQTVKADGTMVKKCRNIEYWAVHCANNCGTVYKSKNFLMILADCPFATLSELVKWVEKNNGTVIKDLPIGRFNNELWRYLLARDAERPVDVKATNPAIAKIVGNRVYVVANTPCVDDVLVDVAFEVTGADKLMIKGDGCFDTFGVWTKGGRVLDIVISKRGRSYGVRTGFIRTGELSEKNTINNLMAREDIAALATQTILSEIYHTRYIRDAGKDSVLTSFQHYLVDRKLASIVP